MKNYELTIVLPGDVTAAKKKKTVEIVEKIITTLKGKIKKSDEWGKLDLAYPIDEKESGVFIHSRLELESGVAKELAAKLKMEEGLMRYLLVHSDKN